MTFGTIDVRLLIFSILGAAFGVSLLTICLCDSSFLIGGATAAHHSTLLSVPFSQTEKAQNMGQDVSALSKLHGSCVIMDHFVLLDITLDQPDKVKMMIHEVGGGGQMMYMRQWTISDTRMREKVDVSQLGKGIYVMHIQSSTKEMKQVLVL